MENKKDIFGIVLGVLFILTGIPKLIGLQMAVDNFNNWFLDGAWHYFVGAIEVILGLVMFVPSLKKYSAFAYFYMMPAAFMIHIIAKEYLLLLMPIIFGSLIFYYLLKQNILQFKK